MRLTRWFLLGLIGAVMATTIGIVTNLLTADGSWQAILEPDNRWLLFVLVGLTLLAALVAFVDSAENNRANGGSQQQGVTDSRLQDSQVMQGQAERDTYQFQNASVVFNQSTATGQPTLSHAEITNRKALLAKVHNNWIKGVLNRSLYSRARIALGLEDRPDMVMHPWQLEYRYASQRRRLPAGTRLITKLRELGEGATLLILGDPGSGKTTMLLELADDLLRQADPAQVHGALPVVFNLSAWSQFRPLDRTQAPTLQGWLVQEFKNKYQIPDNIAQAWIDQNQLVLLLDGLDEVAESRREDCLEAINQFNRDHGTTEIVVCCRIRDFAALPNQLQFQAAVYIEPLKPPQVDAYLSQGGDKLRGIRTVLQLEPELQNPDPDSLKSLAETPLFLNIMALAFEGRSVAEIQKLGGHNQRQAVFDAYIERMFEQRAAHPRYPKAQAQWWLHRLAQQLVQEGQTVFLIEYMQPQSWLNTKVERWLQKLISGITWGLIYGLISRMIWSSFWAFTPASFLGAVIGIVFGVETSLWEIEAVTPLHTLTSREMLRESIKTLGIGAAFGLAWWLIELIKLYLSGTFTLRYEIDLPISLIIKVFLGISVSSFFLIPYLVGRMSTSQQTQIREGSCLNQGTIDSLINSICVIGLSFIILLIIYVNTSFVFMLGILSLNSKEVILASMLLIFQSLVPFWGVITCVGGISHFVLRTTLLLCGQTPRDYADFLDYAEQRLFVQRVGGGYIFVHRLLLEHFASLALAKPGR